ncbi:MAG: TIGR00180 family glycosyltransferase [Syntrophomonas sp.]
MQHKMTIIVPTYNRPDHVKTLMEYFITLFDLTTTKILILDGSEKSYIEPLPHWKQNNIEYKYYGAELPILDRWFDGLNRTETECVGIIADDDIPHSDGYKRCLEFLLSNKSYSAAHGNYTGFKIYKNNKLIYYPTYKPFSIEDDDPIMRLNLFLTNYVPITYALYRTDVLKKAFTEVLTNVDKDDSHWFELLLGCIPVILGKIKYISCPYYARNYGDSIPREPVIYYRLFYKEDFSNKYKRIKDALKKYFPETDINTLSDAIDISFAYYNSAFFNKSSIMNDFKSLLNKNVNHLHNRFNYQKVRILKENISARLLFNRFFSASIKKAYFKK